MTAPTVTTEQLPGTTFTCALCGLRFCHATESCGSCPLASGCGLIQCPGCGYQFPRSSQLLDWVRRLVRRWRSGAP